VVLLHSGALFCQKATAGCLGRQWQRYLWAMMVCAPESFEVADAERGCGGGVAYSSAFSQAPAQAEVSGRILRHCRYSSRNMLGHWSFCFDDQAMAMMVALQAWGQHAVVLTSSAA
jgi:hypothetical protein